MPYANLCTVCQTLIIELVARLLARK
uniref:Uncharacterized protein n=1 Tax=Arundo donax TaxID=35708 RepID=A0A0A9A3F6_ARUDO